MGQEVFGDVLLACGRCGYWSQEGSNVRRHLKKSVCLKEQNYCREDLVGLDRTERRKFLRRLATARSRAKKKAKGWSYLLVNNVWKEYHKEKHSYLKCFLLTNINYLVTKVGAEFFEQL